MSPKRNPSGQKTAHRIFIVSDGTGNTASQALRAALVQFADVNVILERRAEIRSEAHIREVLEQASTADALIVHTMVSKDLRRTMSELVETALRRFFEQKEKLELPQLPTFHEGRERVDIANRGALNVVLGRRILGNVRFDR